MADLHIDMPETAAPLTQGLDLSPHARALAEPDSPIEAYCAALFERRLFDDVLHVFLRGMPPRYAIWSGALCLWIAYRPEPAPEVDEVLKAILKWLVEPSDKRRRAVRDAGSDAGAATPAGILAEAVFHTGGSLSSPDLPEVAPRQNMPGKLALAAVRQASLAHGSKKKDELMQAFAVRVYGVLKEPAPFESPEEHEGRDIEHWASEPASV